MAGRRAVTKQDATVAAEGGIGQNDLAAGRLRRWLTSILDTYATMADTYAAIPPEASVQAQVYGELERRSSGGPAGDGAVPVATQEHGAPGGEPADGCHQDAAGRRPE